MRHHETLSRSELTALDLVRRHDGRFGRLRLAELLAGLPSGRVQEHALDRDPAYGRLRRCGLPAVLAVLDRLAHRGFMDSDPTRGRYLVLELTDLGRRALGLPPRQPRAAPPLFETPRDQALFDALVQRRDALAAAAGLMGSQIAPLRQLRDLVRHRPRTPDEVRIWIPPGAHAASFAGAALEVIQQIQASP